MYVHTDLNDKYIRGSTEEHNHEPNPEMIKAKQFRQQVKERALKEIVPISIIYTEEISKISDSSTTLAILPTSQEICKFILTMFNIKFVLFSRSIT